MLTNKQIEYADMLQRRLKRFSTISTESEKLANTEVTKDTDAGIINELLDAVHHESYMEDEAYAGHFEQE